MPILQKIVIWVGMIVIMVLIFRGVHQMRKDRLKDTKEKEKKKPLLRKIWNWF